MTGSSHKVGLIGTVGVPARYGGFETLAERLVLGIEADQLQFVIYCQESAYPELRGKPLDINGHRRVMLPLRANGATSMIHDVLGMLHAVYFEKVDSILVLGYSGAWFLPLLRLLRPRLRIVTNIDGMEWRRQKFGRLTRSLLKALEWLAARFSSTVIADNAELVCLAEQVHRITPVLIAYGGDHTLIQPFAFMDMNPGYYLSVARIEPENNCHIILESFEMGSSRLVFVGNWSASEYGRKLRDKYDSSPNIILLDPIYELNKLAWIRSQASGYVHGHSVGGTNPSLVEAIFHTNVILAFDCSFNRSTLCGHGSYFANSDALTELLLSNPEQIEQGAMEKVRSKYLWNNIVQDYVDVCIS